MATDDTTMPGIPRSYLFQVPLVTLIVPLPQRTWEFSETQTWFYCPTGSTGTCLFKKDLDINITSCQEVMPSHPLAPYPLSFTLHVSFSLGHGTSPLSPMLDQEPYTAPLLRLPLGSSVIMRSLGDSIKTGYLIRRKTTVPNHVS
jgi:hypothetical protein